MYSTLYAHRLHTLHSILINGKLVSSSSFRSVTLNTRSLQRALYSQIVYILSHPIPPRPREMLWKKMP